jgi:hypothetical protein
VELEEVEQLEQLGMTLGFSMHEPNSFHFDETAIDFMSPIQKESERAAKRHCLATKPSK